MHFLNLIFHSIFTQLDTLRKLMMMRKLIYFFTLRMKYITERFDKHVSTATTQQK